MSKLILTIISTLSIVTMLSAFFYNSIIDGVTKKATAAATISATRTIIDKASKFSKDAKTKLRSRFLAIS